MKYHGGKNRYDDKQFWVGRVSDAKTSKTPHQAVFRVGQDEWGKIVKGRLDVISKYITPFDSVMDAGCGHGWLYENIPNMYVGVDQTPALLDYAKELYPDASFVESTLQQLPFEDDSFDWVVCSCVKEGIIKGEEYGLMEKGRWKKIEAEFLRVAKGAIIWPSYQPDYEVIVREV